MVVAYSIKGDSFVAEKPREWITKIDGTTWEISSDGKHIAVVKPVQPVADATTGHVVVFLQNFVDELRRKAPLPR
jgi:hypothetical protein